MSNLNKKRQQIKRDVLFASHKAGACHLGSALSCMEILIDLFYRQMKKGDIFIFSKASGVATYYAILADKGFFSKEKTAYYLKNFPLVSKEVPGVLWSGGSCGHGLSIAAGIALSKKLKKEKGRIYVLISDGECQEGSTFEAVLFARQHKLKNLFVICDDNTFQACGATKNILDLETAFEFYQKTLPNFKRVKTIKGGNIDFLQGTEGHYKNLTPDLLKQALCQI